MNEDTQQLLNAMRQDNAVAHAETRHYFDAVAAQLRDRFDAVAAQLRDRSDAVAAQLRHRFDVVAEQLEGKIELVAEGVVANSERIDRVDSKIDQLSTDMKSEFSDVRSMTKFSHAELDRRIRTLEEKG